MQNILDPAYLDKINILEQKDHCSDVFGLLAMDMPL
jgi:hypothetical protein|tara:strand:+ start:2329 stop:2436 length:108 start_codon:yes stop_codon:yes gene_type:complete